MNMSSLIHLPSDGWRKTAVINTIIVGFFAIANFSTMVWSLAKSGSSENNVFSQGDCNKISLLNTFLHLLLNIASSLIIASSNFFMQVLNSPTRAEVDRAHTHKRWLEIGVPSLRNVLNVSPYKSLAWALFSLSSIPIHLLFNASIFTVDHSRSEWSMALISETLLTGAPYFLPGAALTLNGAHCSRSKFSNDEYGQEYYDFGNYHPDFQNSPRLASVMATTTQNLSVSDCKTEYQTCQGLRKYGNRVLVISSGDKPTDSQGWTVNDIYNMEETVGNVYNSSALELDDEMKNETFSSIWGPYFGDVSMSQPNALWFSSKCSKVAASAYLDGCQNSCTGPLGIGYSKVAPEINDTLIKSSNWEFPWSRADQSVSSLRSRSSWGQLVNDTSVLGISTLQWPNKCIGMPRPTYLDNSANNIRVRYCLAEPVEQRCQLAIANTLVMVVTSCVFFKLILCISVVLALRDDPLVTPGDAVASFMTDPDPTTVGSCAATMPDIHFVPRERNPIPWQQRPRRLAHAISPTTWVINYVFFIFLLTLLGNAMVRALGHPPLAG